MEEEDKHMAANAEMRYITLELMKIAQKSGKSFDEVAAEFIRNAEKLRMMIYSQEVPAVSNPKAAKTKK
ncbi:MAG: hypothetical protein QXT25_03580 [Candidatus Anstonellaceae archaeon]